MRGRCAGLWRSLGKTSLAGHADPRGAGRQPLLWGDQPAAGAVSPRSAAKHVYVEYRHAHPDRLEYRPAPVAAAVWRRGADAAAAASAHADGPR